MVEPPTAVEVEASREGPGGVSYMTAVEPTEDCLEKLGYSACSETWWDTVGGGLDCDILNKVNVAGGDKDREEASSVARLRRYLK